MKDGYRGSKRGPARPGKEGQPPGYWDELEARRAEEAYRTAMAFRPHNAEAEAALLGALMIDNRWIERVQVRLRPDHFYEPVHARIYERIIALSGRGQIATPISLRPYFEGEDIEFLDEHQQPVRDGYGRYMAGLTGSGAGLIGTISFAKQIRELALLRDVIDVAREMSEVAKNTAEEVEPYKVIQHAEMRLQEIVESSGIDPAGAGKSFSDSWDETVSELDDIAAGKPVPGFKIAGYDDWNEVTGMMEPGDYILLGGRPSMGKTGVACALAVGAASAGIATDFLSLEMSRQKITRRMIANSFYEQGVTSGYSLFNEGRFTAADKVALATARAAIANYPLFISDPKAMNIEDLPGWIRRRKRAWRAQGHEMKLLVIDYLGRFGTVKTFRSPGEEVTYMSKKLKAAFQEEQVVGVVLSQLSRAVEQREDKHPQLIDLRDSGSLEQDADVVNFVYRDEYYLQKSEPSQNDVKKYEAWRDEMVASRDRLELYSTKRREGRPTKRTGYFFANEQAVRPSTFYQSNFDWGGGPAFDFNSGDRE